MVILVGRNTESGQLMVASKVCGKYRTVMLGSEGSVPPSVSRCRPTEEVAHCRLEVSDDGWIKLTNLKDKNTTYVNDQPIISKRITSDSVVQLGTDKYTISIADIIEAAEKLIPESEKTVSIAPLEDVWNQYHDALLALKKRQRNIALLSRAVPIFTLGGVLVSAMIQRVEAYIFTAISFCISIYGFVKSCKDHSIEEGERLTEAFQEEYVCPNCHRFVGSHAYKIIRKTKNCPNCRCKWTE